jgi:DNA repair protein RadA/Sms
MLLAVLEKRGGFKLGNKDVFLNITGGLRIDDPAADLAVIASILSSYADSPIPRHACFAGEVGLSGEIRHVGRTAQRVAEAARLGFKRIFISSASAKGLSRVSNIDIVKVDTVSEMIKIAF